MNNRRIALAITVIAIVVICTSFFVYYKNTYVHFEDENMGKLLAYETGSRSIYFVKCKDLLKIEGLYIGATCNYETLIDIAKCKNLRELEMNNYTYYADQWLLNVLFGREDRMAEFFARDEDEERVEQIQDELDIIFQECAYLEEFYVIDMADHLMDYEGFDPEHRMYIQFTDISFLKHGKELKVLEIASQNSIKDYSVLNSLKKLKVLRLKNNERLDCLEDSLIEQLETFVIVDF